jgi:hypothetical protein
VAFVDVLEAYGSNVRCPCVGWLIFCYVVQNAFVKSFYSADDVDE